MGPRYDLTDRQNRSLITGWITAGRLLGIHLGTPCNTWSRILGSPGGPPALRSDAHVLGLPSLSPTLMLKVADANALMRFTATCVQAARKACIPAVVENPAYSRLWLAPPMKALLRLRDATYAYTDYCMWGEPWRKRTRFLGVLVDLDPVRRLCHGKGAL